MNYLLTIQRFMDESAEARSLVGYDTKKQALSVLYSTMASSMANDNVKTVICIILDENASAIRYERWSRIEEEPEGII